MKYSSGANLRAALDTRLLQEAVERKVDVMRLRRRIVFERLLVRFALYEPGLWVLKGGVAIEVRLNDRARATKDLDLALRQANATSLHVQDLLTEALLSDPQQDFFQFRIDRFRTMNIDNPFGDVWRASVDALLDGRTFDRVTLDIVARAAEVQRVEPLKLPGTLEFANLDTVEVLAVDVYQHFAEKLHGMLTPHGERPSSRVKDLADLILFIEYGLEPTVELGSTVKAVFAARNSNVPRELPQPPQNWEPRYAELAVQLGLTATTMNAAMATLRNFWNATSP